MRFLRTVSVIMAAALCASLSVRAQEKEDADSLVRLISAESGRLDVIDGENYRTFSGEATFLHNNTYLICDTARWNVDRRFINAIGNVRIIQDNTYLTSDLADYIIDENLAQFRGGVVQLRDKDDNVLRTRHLDYNTQDSVAVFQDGASMRSGDGQIIESRNGVYDSKEGTFTFVDDVNMFSDSVFVKTTRLVYRSPLNMAFFGRGTDAWSGDGMLSADDGWYDRSSELFFFRNNVHLLSETQEGWSDSLYYHRLERTVEMLGNAVVTDTTRKVSGLGGKIEYSDSLSRVEMSRNPAVVAEIEEEGGVDTVYFGADTLVYRTYAMFEIDSAVFSAAGQRKEAIAGDPVTEYRLKAAQAAAEAAAAAQAEADKNNPDKRFERTKKDDAAASADDSPKEPRDTILSSSDNIAAPSAMPSAVPPAVTSAAPPSPLADMLAPSSDTLASPSDTIAPPAAVLAPSADSLAVPLDPIAVSADSLAVSADSLTVPLDSLAVPADSLAVPLDSSKVGFMSAWGGVKMYRRNMQFVCDSLVYNDIDSLARLYKNPIIWNVPNRQYYADSVFVTVRGNKIDKANLMSSAFVITEEKEQSCYDQIKGTELVAYFAADGNIARFDALGGASAIFYIEENDELATVNRIEGKMLHAEFVDGEIDKFYFFDQPKNNFMPIVQLKSDEKLLTGFHWDADKRPAGRESITDIALRQSQRAEYEAHPRAKYDETDIYFPGYMDGVYRRIAISDSLKLERKREQKRLEEERAEAARLDSLINVALGTVVLDSLDVIQDSLDVRADSLTTAADSVSGAGSAVLKDKAAERRAAREAKWEAKNKKDEERRKAKEAARLEKRRKATLAELKKQARKAEKEKRAFEKYKARYEKRKARAEAARRKN